MKTKIEEHIEKKKLETDENIELLYNNLITIKHLFLHDTEFVSEVDKTINQILLLRKKLFSKEKALSVVGEKK